MSFFIDRQGHDSEKLTAAADRSQLAHIPFDDQSTQFSPDHLTMEIPSESDLDDNLEFESILTSGKNNISSLQTNVHNTTKFRNKTNSSSIKQKSSDARRKRMEARTSKKLKDNFQPTKKADLSGVAAQEGVFFCGPLADERNDSLEELPAKLEIAQETISQYRRGERFHSSHIKQAKVKHKLEREENKIEDAVEKAAKWDLFLSEQPGYVDVEDEELLTLDQDTIQKSVDIASAQKRFDLSLKQFGPYKINYNRNGRYLLIGGKLGHVATFDWARKSLCCEMNVMETVNDVCWLHNENMFAVAQKRWVFIYDRAGVELHALRQLDRVKTMQFLPYHFLLTTMNDLGFITYLDVSIGQVVSTLSTGLKGVQQIKQNPQNAVVFSAHPNGIVNLWAPSSNKPLAKIACHGSAISSFAIDHSGNYLTTCGIDRRLRIFDLRTFAPIHSYKMNVSARSLDFSHRGLLSAAFPRNVDIFKGITSESSVVQPYLTHRLHKTQIGNVQFCPYEDVLGIGHQLGVSSILVPGSGEPNFDALESNPYATKQQRKEAEVKHLLDKIQPELISLDQNSLIKVQKVNDGAEEESTVPPVVQVKLKNKAKGKNKAQKKELRKSAIKESEKRKFLQEQNIKKRKQLKQEKKCKKPSSEVFDPLNRFKPKK